jgi:hypothetical protein
MTAGIRTGRCQIPPEWRPQLGLRWRKTAVIAVTGARSAHDATVILARHLPLILTDQGGLPSHGEMAPGLTPAPGAGFVHDAAGEPRWEGQEPSGTVEDLHLARAMVRRLSRWRPARGARALFRAGFLPPHVPAVYAWTAARNGQYVFRVAPDGTFAAVAMFRAIKQPLDGGRWRTELSVGRPW